VETTVETAVMIQGRAHRKTMKRHRLDPLSLIQGKRREHRPSNANQRHAPSGGEQGGPAMETSVTRQWQILGFILQEELFLEYKS